MESQRLYIAKVILGRKNMPGNAIPPHFKSHNRDVMRKTARYLHKTDSYTNGMEERTQK